MLVASGLASECICIDNKQPRSDGRAVRVEPAQIINMNTIHVCSLNLYLHRLLYISKNGRFVPDFAHPSQLMLLDHSLLYLCFKKIFVFTESVFK